MPSTSPTTFFGWVVFLLEQYGPLFLRGAGMTMLIAISGTILGFLIGLLVGIARTIELGPRAPIWKRALVRLLNAVLGIYIEVFRGTPMMVQAMVIFYGIPYMGGPQLPTLQAAILIISINTGAYMAEIVRGGIISIDRGQTEAARSIGMTHWQTMVTVVLPQAVRNIMPSIGNEFVVNIKDSSVLNVISVTELYFQGKSAAGLYYRYFEAFFIIAVIYFILTFTVTRILRLIEKKMDGPDNYVICGSQSDSRAADPRGTRRRRRHGAWKTSSTFGTCASPSARTKYSRTSTFPWARARWPASSAPPARAKARFCAASTCWRRRTPARSSSTARTCFRAMCPSVTTTPAWAWCFSSSTSLTT